MIVGTFNGANVIQAPTSKFVEMDWTAHDADSMSQSPWTGQSQVYQWGAQWWALTIAFPSMSRADMQPWQAFLLELSGRANVFLAGMYGESQPLGSYNGTGLTLANAGASGNSIVVAGFPVSTNNCFLPGDCIQIGYRLYKILEPVDSNSTGQATLSIWPQLRDSPAQGTAVITTGCQGLFRLAKNDRGWNYNPHAAYTIPTLHCLEAL